MNWIKIENFDYSRTGEVIMIMKDKKGNQIVREDSIWKMNFDENPEFIFNDASNPTDKILNKIIIKRDDHYELFGCSRASFSNVIAFVFKDELINDFNLSNK